MKFRQIEAFRQVISCETMKLAADRLSISQPAVSRLIADLENYIGFQLFDRIRGRLQPTARAIRFYKAVERNFSLLEDLDDVARRIREDRPGELRICATSALSTAIFPKAAKRFTKTYQDIFLKLETVGYTEIIERLKMQTTDLAITVYSPELEGIEQQLLMEAEYVCAMAKDHPLSERHHVTVKDFENENVLKVLASGPMDWSRLDNVFVESGITVRRQFGTQNSHAGYSLIAEGLAIALIEPFAAGPWLANGVITKPFRPALTYNYVIAIPHASLLSPIVMDFVEAAKSTTNCFHKLAE